MKAPEVGAVIPVAAHAPLSITAPVTCLGHIIRQAIILSAPRGALARR